MHDEPALEIDCPVCDAEVGEPCVDAAIPHLARQDQSGDPGVFAGIDGDGDGIDAWHDLDDPASWLG